MARPDLDRRILGAMARRIGHQQARYMRHQLRGSRDDYQAMTYIFLALANELPTRGWAESWARARRRAAGSGWHTVGRFAAAQWLRMVRANPELLEKGALRA